MAIDWTRLRAAAAEVAQRAHAPYSLLRVGAAGETGDGRVVVGCNVENASYGLTLCAECGLVSALHATGGGGLAAVSVVSGDGHRLLPCGRCRQLLLEAGGPSLLVATGACAIHCRYCFRRHFPYGEATAAKQQWQAALDYIAADDTIEEVILSGGDPLLLDDARLESLVGGLERIRHVQRLRLHSRVPVVLPERIDDALLGWLRRSRLQPVVVIHANHPRELDDSVARALAPLRATGTTLLNQTVLLRGVNDDTDILRQLSVRLHQLGVLPYYLHLLDRVTGAAHFDVPEPRAMALWETLRRQLPGYLVPRLARERAGAPYKLQPSAISQPT